MNALLSLSSAFGLSGAAGLNAYIPLLLMSILANRGMIHLHSPYDVMRNPWCIAILSILCVMELVIDKIPGADHINDIIQTFIRPTAGAILFASQAGTIYGVHPGVWIVVGLLLSGGVHAVKSFARPAVNLATFGIGGPVVSTAEDLVSTVVSMLALLAPIFCVAGMVVFTWIFFKAYRQLKDRVASITAVTPPLPLSPPSRELELAAVAATWNGGV